MVGAWLDSPSLFLAGDGCSHKCARVQLDGEKERERKRADAYKVLTSFGSPELFPKERLVLKDTREEPTDG